MVEDDGVGFDPSRLERNTFGFFSIRERLKNFGGAIEIWSEPGKGTRVSLTAPSPFRSTVEVL
jgi:signal transduction histidine kinase